MKLIEYKNVDICRKDLVVLKDVTFSVEDGEFVFLLGSVGSGKSSLLKTMYAEVGVASGDALVHDYFLPKLKRRQIPYLRRMIGIVFQDFQLLTDRSVFENLRFVLKATGWKDKKEIEARIQEVLSAVDMDTKAYKMPHELSGGEQQRIVIARALLNNPGIILADEPTGNLDPDAGRQIVELLYNLTKKKSTTVIMATHNIGLVNEFPARILKIVDKHLVEE